MKIIIVLALSLSLGFLSCKKDNGDPNPINKSTIQLLTAHPWQLESAMADKEVDVIDDETDYKSTNLYAQRASCQTDNVITFITGPNGDRTGIKGVGAMKCDEDEQDVSFNWSLENEGTVLKLSEIFYATAFTILEINDNTLKVVYDATDENGTGYSATEVYKRP